MSPKKSIIIGLILILVAGGLVLFRKYNTDLEIAPIVPINTWPTHEVIGKSVEGRDIDSYTYGTGSQKLVFVGGIHGGYEWNSVFLAYNLMDYLDSQEASVPKNLSITVIPSLNPDGVYKVVGKEGRFTASDVSTNKTTLATARFNAHGVDLNRNFDCNWKPKSTWQSKTVSAGTSVFSEPEAKALKKFVASSKPDAFVFWHSQSNAVYGSQCKNGILPETLGIMDLYAKAAGYPAVKVFDSYEITGDVADWLATIDIPAITVELKTHESVEWDKNLLGIKALLKYYSEKVEDKDPSTTYIRAIDWPPKVQTVAGPFTCTTAGTETARAGGTEKITINNHDYCLTRVSEGAAGSTYIQYAYAFPVGNEVKILTFSLQFIQCGNYDEPKKSACEKERASFDINSIIDKIVTDSLL